jgi:hypothetical protein
VTAGAIRNKLRNPARRHDICARGEPLGCGDTLSAGAGVPVGQQQQLCQRQLRAPKGQRVRLAIDAVNLAPGAFLLVFDGATQTPLAPDGLQTITLESYHAPLCRT